MFKSKLKKFFQTSIRKTIRFNVRYFGVRAIFKPRILIARNVKLCALKGNINFNGVGRVSLGYTNEYPSPSKRNKTFFWNYGGEITFYGNVNICRGASIYFAKGSRCFFGERVHIGPSSTISASNEIVIENDVSISWDCLVMDSDGHKIFDCQGEQCNLPKPIHIGQHCWIGCGSVILKGASLPNNTIIAAKSTVTKKLCEENAVYAGNKVVKENVTFEW